MHSTKAVARCFWLAPQPARLPTSAGAQLACGEPAADAHFQYHLHAASGRKAEG